MATGPDPRSPMGNSSIRGLKWGKIAPREELDELKVSPIG